MEKTHRQKWLDAMIKKHGSEEAVREFMKEAQRKSREKYKGTGGFAANKKLASEAGKLGAEKRWGNVRTNNTNTETKNDTKG